NIACGGHTGDEISMRKATRIALRRFVAINAHPAYQDAPGFGREAVAVTPEELELSLLSQIETLRNIVRQEEGELTGVKPHGALYHEAARNPEVAAVVARAAWAVSPRLVLITSPGSRLLEAGAEVGMTVATEGFVDRAYRPDGGLVSRKEPGALITDPQKAVDQALAIIREGRVRTTNGSDFALKVDTLCIHGDTPNARDVAPAVRQAPLES